MEKVTYIRFHKFVKISSACMYVCGFLLKMCDYISIDYINPFVKVINLFVQQTSYFLFDWNLRY